ncbi:hydroxymethylpyrimidine/phosphomethylpyrimidine kinase [Methanofollis sp. W23]|uniref:thiamine-phosphate synthase family protein n=1 Tax=Methanofollis sp. W23 TaxID=2817849 RepID=UPI001AE22FB4|nr:thiamine-phosphate synthase family protein [Methanofollis sp. W23]MBP2145225.1 hydroxymethylpyrimidine/phosphomethylpyrimidine kinase [Methanofollis sp. W23]
MTGDERDQVLRHLAEAVELLKEEMDPALIPEVGTNIVYAMEKAREPADVAAVEGRIVRLADRVHPVGVVAFGASDHVARIVLTAMRFDRRVRAAANIRYADVLVDELVEMMLDIRYFERAQEPPGIKTMDWGVASCCKTGVPDIIYDRGAVGKEPMIRVLGEDPMEVAHNILKLSGRIKDTKLRDRCEWE